MKNVVSYTACSIWILYRLFDVCLLRILYGCHSTVTQVIGMYYQLCGEDFLTCVVSGTDSWEGQQKGAFLLQL